MQIRSFQSLTDVHIITNTAESFKKTKQKRRYFPKCSIGPALFFKGFIAQDARCQAPLL